ncbi:MAG: FAD-dependent oxidoreductase [Celeribacter sp.]|jgi:sarcosine oxidase
MSMRYDHVIIGAGMMGAAAARHLSRTAPDARNLLIGPSEPAVPADHSGPFASHYDAGRVTRGIDPDPDWAQLARRSMARYAEIAAAGGMAFHHPVGAMLAGPDRPDGFIARTFATAHSGAIACKQLSGAALAQMGYNFPAGTGAVVEAGDAGFINPRALVRCQITAAQRAGIAHIQTDVQRITPHRDHIVLTLGCGTTIEAEQVLLATGGYAGLDGMCDAAPPLTVHARTIAMVEVSETTASRLKALPALIWRPDPPGFYVYVVPPARYRDGTMRIKIGGDPADRRVHSAAEANAWFQRGGDREVAAIQIDILRHLLPDLPVETVTHSACIISDTASGLPVIGRLTPRVSVMVGGNGAAAKSSDEIGRLGALTLIGGDADAEGYLRKFAP